MIFCSFPHAQYLSYQSEIDAAVTRVLTSGHYILGPEVQAFEQAFAEYIGNGFAVGVGSGTDALQIGLKALGIGPGDEVITVSHTAVATVAAIELAGAVPVLVDIDPEFYTMNLNQVEAAITHKTKAVVAVHIYGQAADLKGILTIAKKYHLKVIEDCAQTIGADYNGQRVGSFGDAACFSFYPTKNLGAIGDGGIIVVKDAAVAQLCRQLREYGWDDQRQSLRAGLNSRLDEVQAAILNVKLKYLDCANARRVQIARWYERELAGSELILPSCRENATHTYHLYVVRSRQRDVIKNTLKKNGILAGIHYPVPVHQQPAYQGRVRSLDMRETERASLEILSLPMYPELTEDNIQQIASIILSMKAGV